MSFFGDVIDWFSGDSLGANLAKTAILGYTSRLLTASISDDEEINANVVDPGSRIQLDPDTDNSIPILYGQAYFGGFISDVEVTTDYKTMRYVLTLAELTGNHIDGVTPTSYTFKDIYLDRNKVEFKADGITVDHTIDNNGNIDPSMNGLVKVYFYATNPTQPEGHVGTTPASDTIMSNWTPGTHPMTGLMYAIIEVTYDRAKNVTGLPTAEFHLDTDLTLPGDVLNDYMTNTVYGAGIDASAIDDASLIALNVYGSTGFSYTDANSQAQTGAIDINGLISTKTKVLSNMEAITRSVSSWMSYDVHTGLWAVTINQPGTAVADIDESNIVGNINVTGTALSHLYNATDVKYQNTDILDRTDFVKINMPPGDLLQNEPITTLQINLPYTNKQSVALKVGILALKQSRVDKLITFTTDYSYVDLHAGELITVSSPVFNYVNKIFRISSIDEIDTINGIELKFRCIEYDADVYDYNISEFNIETDDGLLSIGSIGKPDSPIIDNNQQGPNPNVIINGKIPSGVVDRMEYWVTFDTTVPVDNDRTYIQIGAQSNTNGAPFTENQTVPFTYNQLTETDFFAKVRGTNNITTGPFSDPSGLIQYVPLQIADTVSDELAEYPLGGSLMGIGLLTLLNNIDELLAVFNGEKGIFDTIKEIFYPGTELDPDTAADLLLDDPDFINGLNSAGVGTPGALDDLTDVTVPTPANNDYLTFNGSDWVNQAVLPGGGASYLDELLDVHAPAPEINDQIYWDGFKWIARSCGTCDVDATLLDCFKINALCPLSNFPQPVPSSGSCFIRYQKSNFYGDLTSGSGTVSLYNSDGLLIENLLASQCIFDGNVIEIPFADRQFGTDYYILMDEGIGEYCDGCLTPCITQPSVWNFTTSLTIEDDCLLESTSLPFPPEITIPAFNDLSLLGHSPIDGQYDKCSEFNGKTNVQLYFNQTIKPGSGTIRVYNSGDSLLQSVNICGANLTGNVVTLPVLDLIHNESYYILMDPGVVQTINPPESVNGIAGEYADDCGVIQIINQQYDPVYLSDQVSLTSELTFDTPPVDEVYVDSTTEMTNLEAVIDYNRPVTEVGSTGDALIYDDSDTLLATIPANDARVTIESSDPLAITLSNPMDNEVDVALLQSIEMTFNQSIIKGVGNFFLFKDGATLVQTFDVTTAFDPEFTYALITVGGDTVVLNPTSKFETNTVYHIEAEAGVILGGCGESWVGISSSTELNFTTTPGELIQNIGNTPISDDGVVELEYLGDIEPGYGDLAVYDSPGNNLLATIESSDSRVTIINS